jgi:hypothetical protein
MYEIFFISYNELNAEQNWIRLKSKFPTANRIDKVKGIREAHIAAAKKSWTNLFYVVDGDAEIVDDFLFDYVPDNYNKESVHIWYSINPVNDLEYGYGGIKLLPKKSVITMDFSKPDMTTSLSDNMVILPKVSNITRFNTDPFNSWKSAFRECVKLSSKVIDRNYDEETTARLESWCTKGEDREFGKYVLSGASFGKEYGNRNIGDLEALSKINDFDWLLKLFEDIHGRI